MGTNEEKRIVEDKKYAQLPRESIRLFAEAASHPDLPENIIALLAEDLNFRLRETVHNASLFLRHSTQRKLTVDDFNNSLRWSNVEPVLGHSNQEPVRNLYIREAEIFCTEDNEVNLLQATCLNKEYDVPPPTSISVKWLAINGIPKCNSSGSVTAVSGSDVPIPHGPENGHYALPEEQKAYYDQVTKAILGSDEKLLKLALGDLSINAKIVPSFPYFANFVSVGVKKMSHDLAQLTKLLQTIRALVSNPYLYIELQPCLELLVQSVLYCIVEPLAASINPINDHWVLRDSAAHLLVKIVHKWSTPVNNLNESVVGVLESIFNDLSKPFCSHYGALVALMAFGTQAIENVLYPHVSGYWPHLMCALDGCSYSNAQIKTDAQKVYGLLLVVSDILIRSRLKKEFGIPFTSDNFEHCPFSVTENLSSVTHLFDDQKNLKSSYQMYSEFYEYFGDSLAARLPYIADSGVYIPKEFPSVDLFFSPELMRSGDELLEIFYEKDDDIKSNSLDDDNSYDDRDDMSVLSDEHEADPVDLQVKSTVSDPTLGIKLTIAKMRRIKPVEEPKPAKKRKIVVKESKENDQDVAFAPMIRQNDFIEFNFEGATPLPACNLRRRMLDSMNMSNSDSFLLSSEINSRLKKTGRKKVVDSKVTYRKKFITGNLLSVL